MASPLSGPSRAALDRLLEGNHRFAAGAATSDRTGERARLPELAAGQRPFAAILGCADSRAAPEILFDQGLGDLFVIRAAGNITGVSTTGSVEFAVGQLGVPLVVVLGHTRCGAVAAALDVLAGGVPPAGPLGGIVERVRPGIESALREQSGDPEALARAAEEAHVRATVARLLQESPPVAGAVEAGRLAVVGAVFDLATGAVAFLDL